MDKQSYHKPEFSVYGHIRSMTQAAANTNTSMTDNGADPSMDKTS